ncbi:UGSC family (seleno)protein, partial [Chloroflexota bacterium]
MTDRVEIEDSLEAINGYLYQRQMTDGLPVIPPTEERVSAMIKASNRNAGDVIGQVPPLWAPATVDKIAINSVMAGCEPGYMPAIIATVEAFLDPV